MRTARKATVLLLLGALVLVGCGEDGEGVSDDDIPEPTARSQATANTADHGHAHGAPDDCDLGGTTLTLVANTDTTFNTQCLAAPANQPFTITYDIRGGRHGLQVLESHTATTSFFEVEPTQGPTTVTVPGRALPPGKYAFHCQVHPQTMSGTFVVK
jgi:plastocyanin